MRKYIVLLLCIIVSFISPVYANNGYSQPPNTNPEGEIIYVDDLEEVYKMINKKIYPLFDKSRNNFIIREAGDSYVVSLSNQSMFNQFDTYAKVQVVNVNALDIKLYKYNGDTNTLIETAFDVKYNSGRTVHETEGIYKYDYNRSVEVNEDDCIFKSEDVEFKDSFDIKNHNKAYVELVYGGGSRYGLFFNKVDENISYGEGYKPFVFVDLDPEKLIGSYILGPKTNGSGALYKIKNDGQYVLARSEGLIFYTDDGSIKPQYIKDKISVVEPSEIIVFPKTEDNHALIENYYVKYYKSFDKDQNILLSFSASDFERLKFQSLEHLGYNLIEYSYVLKASGNYKMVASKYVKETYEPSSWAKASVNKTKRNPNYNDGTLFYDYKKEISREAFAYIGVKLYEELTGIECAVGDASFEDSTNPWVLKAKNHGLVSGVGDNKYLPKSLITREELAVLFVNILKVCNLDYKAEFEVPFIDDDEFSKWAIASIYIAKANHIVSGIGGNIYSPKGFATKEQAMVMLNNVLDGFLVDEAKSYDSLRIKSKISKLLDDNKNNIIINNGLDYYVVRLPGEDTVKQYDTFSIVKSTSRYKLKLDVYKYDENENTLIGMYHKVTYNTGAWLAKSGGYYEFDAKNHDIFKGVELIDKSRDFDAEYKYDMNSYVVIKIGGNYEYGLLYN